MRLKARIPVKTVCDHKGNILYEEIEEIELTQEQIDAFCALIVNELKERGYVMGKELESVCFAAGNWRDSRK